MGKVPAGNIIVSVSTKQDSRAIFVKMTEAVHRLEITELEKKMYNLLKEFEMEARNTVLISLDPNEVPKFSSDPSCCEKRDSDEPSSKSDSTQGSHLNKLAKTQFDIELEVVFESASHHGRIGCKRLQQ